MTDATSAIEGCYFLSYSRSDEAFALRLARDIRAQGVGIWVDQLDIRPSEHWDRAIERAVRDCRGIVVILSPRSVASDNVADEISFAIDHSKSVLPVMIERCVLPLRITRMQVIDATGNYDKALRDCLAELRQPAEALPAKATAAAERDSLDSAAVSAAKRRLAAVVGPIAGVLVDKAASRAGSVGELYRLLALHIVGESDREAFLQAIECSPVVAPLARTGSVDAADVGRIADILARYLGPIAPVLAKREAARCASAAELTERLSERIPTLSERAEFLRQV